MKAAINKYKCVSGTIVSMVVAFAVSMLTCQAQAQPWLQHAYNGPTTQRQAFRLVCPRAFPRNYKKAKPHQPFWLPQLQHVTTWVSPRARPPHDVSIATQFTVERLHALHAQCRYWEGTIAAALYLPIDNNNNLVFSVKQLPDITREVLGNARTLQDVVQAMERWFLGYMQGPRMRCAMDVAVYYEVVHDFTEWSSHPINAMANRGLAMVNTELVIAVNCDFVPGPRHFREQLLFNDRTYAGIVKMLGNGTDVLVLNAIDTHVDSGSLTEHHRIAHHTLQYGSKANISRWVLENKLIPFQEFGHQETNWTRWVNATEPYYVKYVTFDGVWPSEYEPFFIARRESHPWYDERYRGYYNNKMSVTWTMKMLGTRFLVYPQAYVLHYAHTRAGSTFETGGKHKEMNTHLYWHDNPKYVRDGCGVPVPFVADVSPDCAQAQVRGTSTLECLPYSA